VLEGPPSFFEAIELGVGGVEENFLEFSIQIGVYPHTPRGLLAS
jgi:hypothetical protein